MSKSSNHPVSRSVSRSEADRLGKLGSYRLGGVGGPGGWPASPPRQFQPSFDRRPQHRGSTLAWLIGAAAATAGIAAGAAAGLWFMPFVLGVITGVVMRWGGWRLRVTGPAVVLMAAAGWGLALWLVALRGVPVGATARVIAAMSGLPAVAALAVAIALAVSGALGLAGLWLGRAVAPRLPLD